MITKVKVIAGRALRNSRSENGVVSSTLANVGRTGHSDPKIRIKIYATKNSGNDIGSMDELIKRRFSKDNERTLPNLVIIDGGKAHLNSAMKTFVDLGLDDLNLISISKGARRKLSFDSIHLADGQTIQMNSSSVFCRFIQEIRDETHRFAITSLKKRRSKSSIKSSLDNLSGIGSSRKKILLRYFGSLEQIKRASIEDLSEVSGIGRTTAESIFKQLHS